MEFLQKRVEKSAERGVSVLSVHTDLLDGAPPHCWGFSYSHVIGDAEVCREATVERKEIHIFVLAFCHLDINVAFYFIRDSISETF